MVDQSRIDALDKFAKSLIPMAETVVISNEKEKITFKNLIDQINTMHRAQDAVFPSDSLYSLCEEASADEEGLTVVEYRALCERRLKDPFCD